MAVLVIIVQIIVVPFFDGPENCIEGLLHQVTPEFEEQISEFQLEPWILAVDFLLFGQALITLKEVFNLLDFEFDFVVYISRDLLLRNVF